MAKKVQKNLKLDAGILAEFEKIADRKKEHHNREIEEMMKAYIARDGQLIFDDLYAPRIAHSVKQAVDDQINRLAKMIYQAQVDATAALYSTPIFYNQTLKGMEDILENFMNVQLLNPTRSRISNKNSLNENGQQAVRNLRNIAITDHKDNKKKKTKEEMKV